METFENYQSLQEKKKVNAEDFHFHLSIVPDSFYWSPIIMSHAKLILQLRISRLSNRFQCYQLDF